MIRDRTSKIILGIESVPKIRFEPALDLGLEIGSEISFKIKDWYRIIYHRLEIGL